MILVGKIFTLTSSVKSVITAALDDLITELGKNCMLVYPPKMTACVNCVYDPIGKKSSNVYLSGGPTPFGATQRCPMCDGAGRMAIPVQESIKLLCSLDPKKFFMPVPDIPIGSPEAYLQTKGMLSDLPKIKRADFLIFQTDISGIIEKKFRLFKEPADISNIIQGRYFVATWKQFS